MCYYHGHSNGRGVKGGHAGCTAEGHAGCTAECDTTPIYRHMCEGHMAKCQHCNFTYCAYHSEPAKNAAQLKGGHVCDGVTTGGRVVNQVVEPVKAAVLSLATVGGFLPSERVEMARAQEELASLNIEPDRDSAAPLLELALMATAVYALHDYPTIRDDPIFASELRELERCGWHLDHQEQQPHYDGASPRQLAMAVFVKEEDHLAVVAHKGTSCATDWNLDVSSVVMGAVPRRPLTASARLVKEYQRRGYRVMVTGHSLGGYMSEVVASHLQICGAGFCVPGSGWHAPAKTQGFQSLQVTASSSPPPAPRATT